MGSTWVTYGTVKRAHGVRGELRVRALDPSIPLPESATQVRLALPGGDERLVAVAGRRPIHEGVLILFEGINTREEARTLVGSGVQIDPSLLPAPETGEFYVYELEGARVVDREGRELGQIRSVFDNHGQGLLAVAAPSGERLLPLVPETVIRFERSLHTLTVQVPPGLWEEHG